MSRHEDLHDTEVFADELQARGDPRGELLSLELAAARATTSEEARRLHREAQRIRDAHESLVWPEPLRNSYVDMRSGFVVEADCEELFAAHVPSELALSVRNLWTNSRRICDLMPTLVRARTRGLALDSLWQNTREGVPTNLAGLRALAAVPGRWPTIRTLELGGTLEHIDAIASLSGLERLGLDAPTSAAQLRELAGLELDALQVRTERIEPALIELCGATVQRLELRGCQDSLAPLRELPRLRSLTLSDDPSARSLASLAQLSQLEDLTIPTLDDPRTLDALRALRLQSLHVHTIAAELLPALASLTNVESLGYSEIIGERVDLTPLLERPNSGSLAITTSLAEELVLPATVESLIIQNVAEPLAVVGTPSELLAFDCDPRCLPAALLLGVRRLTVDWHRGPFPDLLDELPVACPNLEQLELFAHDLQWSEAPRVLEGLPHLRRLSLGRNPPGAIAILARALPHLNVNHCNAWPRSCGQASRISVGGAQLRSVTEDRSPFAALLAWAAELRNVQDRRAELLDLELNAELVDDPREARAINREANRVRTQSRATSWLQLVGQARALLRAGMPIHSDANWIRSGSSEDALPWLRSVEIEQEQYAPIPLSTLGRARRLGTRLQRLSLGREDPRRSPHDDQYTSEALVRALVELRQLDALELHRTIFREQLAQLPALGLRHLALCVENYEPAFINRFAATLESLTLTATGERGMLDALELPRLATLELGRGWDPAWALARGDLRSLAFSLEDELPELDWPQLEALALELHGHQAGDVVRRLPSRVPKLARLRLWCENSRSEPLAFDCQAMPSLVELALECSSPSVLELALPHPLTRLRVSGFATVAVDGECERLESSAATLTQLPSELCERVQQLMVLGDTPPSRSTLERFAALEYLSIPEQTPSIETWLRELDAAPRLRTLVVRRLPLDRIARLTELRPELAIHVVEPGWRDPDRWPRPPE